MLNIEFLISVAKDMGIEISEPLAATFDRYATLLVDYNTRVNLTAIIEPKAVAVKHFIDSLLLFKALDIPQNANIIDVGAGAGFPGVPCKLYRSDLHVALLDSQNKRITFLKALAAELGVDFATILGRAEEMGQNQSFRERFDIATARAVARLPELCEYCLPFVKTGGYFVAMKGSDAEKEGTEALNAISALGGRLEKIEWFTLPDEENSKRGIILIKKISQTPTAYPRNGGQMKKKPL